ncbi:MAG: transketolase [Candidatus Nomurabacteria bacterium]|nr:transketolase [Candidatus Nomurabacteria bacterium]
MSTTVSQIEKHAANMRRNIVKMLGLAGSGHPAGALGLADIFAALYFEILRFNPRRPDDPERDLLVLSAGHVCPVLYAALAERGLIDERELWTLRQFGSRLQGHPERERLPWLETTSGPLGCGISQAAGMAYTLLNWDNEKGKEQPEQKSHFLPGAMRKTVGLSHVPHVYVITGDGELDEGNNWEALMFAAKNNLHNLTLIIDRNNIQIDGTTEYVMPLEPLDDKLKSFGLNVIQINGNNVESFIDACQRARATTDRPSAIIAHTIPGRGVSFMENNHEWHGRAPTADEAKKALAELGVL